LGENGVNLGFGLTDEVPDTEEQADNEKERDQDDRSASCRKTVCSAEQRK
jgi:hypothetical protein